MLILFLVIDYFVEKMIIFLIFMQLYNFFAIYIFCVILITKLLLFTDHKTFTFNTTFGSSNRYSFYRPRLLKKSTMNNSITKFITKNSK